MEKTYGTGSIQTADDVKLLRYPYQLHSGSIGLDLALGPAIRKDTGHWQSGYVPGRMIEIFGPEASGKTTLCLKALAAAQQMGGVGAFIDVEHALDPKYAQMLGVDLGKLHLSQPDSAEEALDIADRLLKSGQFAVIVLDSIAALVPMKEVEGDMGDSNMGVAAKLFRQACRKFTASLGQGVPTSMFFTNQITHKIGVVYGNPETTTGGSAMKYFASYRIDIRRTGEYVPFEGSQPVGNKVRCKVVKNKAGPPYRQVEFNTIHGKGVDMTGEILDLGVECGAIEVKGAFHYRNGKSIGQGRYNALCTIANDPVMLYQIYDEIMTKHLAQQGYNPDLTKIEGHEAHQTKVYFAGPPVPFEAEPTIVEVEGGEGAA